MLFLSYIFIVFLFINFFLLSAGYLFIDKTKNIYSKYKNNNILIRKKRFYLTMRFRGLGSSGFFGAAHIRRPFGGNGIDVGPWDWVDSFTD
uniref:Uncharacterized protein n=1 Tax=Strongyloides stercoralis TaxID=6248 RepID=A0A0K0EBH6_STRER